MTLLITSNAQFAPTPDSVPFPSLYRLDAYLEPSQMAQKMFNFIFSSSPSYFSATFNFSHNIISTAAMVLCPRTTSLAVLANGSCNVSLWSSLDCLPPLILSSISGSYFPVSDSVNLSIPEERLPYSAGLFLVRCMRLTEINQPTEEGVVWKGSLSFHDGGSTLDETQAPLAVIYPVLLSFSVIVVILVGFGYDISLILKRLVLTYFIAQMISLILNTAGWILNRSSTWGDGGFGTWENFLLIFAFYTPSFVEIFARATLSGYLIFTFALMITFTKRFGLTPGEYVRVLLPYIFAISFLFLLSFFMMIAQALFWIHGNDGQWARWVYLASGLTLSVACFPPLAYLFSQSTHTSEPSYEVVAQSSEMLDCAKSSKMKMMKDTTPPITSEEKIIQTVDLQANEEEVEGTEDVSQQPVPVTVPTRAEMYGILALYLALFLLPSIWNFLLPAIAPTVTWRTNWLQPIGSYFISLFIPFGWVVCQSEFSLNFLKRT